MPDKAVPDKAVPAEPDSAPDPAPDPAVGPDSGPDSGPAPAAGSAKERIRRVALELYAERGEDATSMRAIAAAADVTVGLLVHHFGTKDKLRESVEELIIEHFTEALDLASAEGSPAEIAAARDRAIERMLADKPALVNYMRRSMLSPAEPKGQLLQRLTDLSMREITKLRSAGKASTVRDEDHQVIGLMIRQLGQLFLQPMVDTMWSHLAGPTAAPGQRKPALRVSITEG